MIKKAIEHLLAWGVIGGSSYAFWMMWRPLGVLAGVAWCAGLLMQIQKRTEGKKDG